MERKKCEVKWVRTESLKNNLWLDYNDPRHGYDSYYEVSETLTKVFRTLAEAVRFIWFKSWSNEDQDYFWSEPDAPEFYKSHDQYEAMSDAGWWTIREISE